MSRPTTKTEREMAQKLDRDRLAALMALHGGSFPGPGAASADAKGASAGKSDEKTDGPAGNPVKMAEQAAAKKFKSKIIDTKAWPAALASFTFAGIFPEGILGFLGLLTYKVLSAMEKPFTVKMRPVEDLGLVVLFFFYLFLTIAGTVGLVISVCLINPICTIYVGKEIFGGIIQLG